jgi:hypothetical protein
MYQPEAKASPPDNDLPYTVVTHNVADARRAFEGEHVAITVRSPGATATTLGNHGDVLEVDVFGDPEKVKQTGFSDYTIRDGRYVHFSKNCDDGAQTAERWHGNVRVIVNCLVAGSAADMWLERVDRALSRL